MIGILYRYPHPTKSNRIIYVGQGAKRDCAHRGGRTSFGRRFKNRFSDTELPQPIRWIVEVADQFELNELETIAMFQFHSWQGYEDGMNLLLPGSQNYKILGKLVPYDARIRGGRKSALIVWKNPQKMIDIHRKRVAQHPEEAKRLQKIIKDAWKNPIFRNNQIKTHLGHKQSPEAIAKTAAANRGRKRSKEFKQTLSESRKGTNNPMFSRPGAIWTKEMRHKLSESRRGKNNPAFKHGDYVKQF